MTNYQNRQRGGSALAIIIIVLIIALGGLYFLYKKGSTVTQTNTVKNEQASANNAEDAALFNELQAAGNADVSADLTNLDQAVAK